MKLKSRIVRLEEQCGGLVDEIPAELTPGQLYLRMLDERPRRPKSTPQNAPKITPAEAYAIITGAKTNMPTKKPARSAFEFNQT